MISLKLTKSILIWISPFVLLSCNETQVVCNKWKTDPNGCQNIRNSLMANRILEIGLTDKTKDFIIGQIGNPDKEQVFDGELWLYWFFNSQCDSSLRIKEQPNWLEIKFESDTCVFSNIKIH